MGLVRCERIGWRAWQCGNGCCLSTMGSHASHVWQCGGVFYTGVLLCGVVCPSEPLLYCLSLPFALSLCCLRSLSCSIRKCCVDVNVFCYAPHRLKEMVLKWLPVTHNQAIDGEAPSVGDTPIKTGGWRMVCAGACFRCSRILSLVRERYCVWHFYRGDRPFIRPSSHACSLVNPYANTFLPSLTPVHTSSPLVQCCAPRASCG